VVDVQVIELAGVYDARGGLLGEAAYLWGRLRGTRHCSLCDLTHSPIRRKPEWDRMVATLAVPVRLLHLDELDDAIATAVTRTGAPVVLARTANGWDVLVTQEELEASSGSVERVGALLRERLDAGTGHGPGASGSP
jgi:hypothetical protein